MPSNNPALNQWQQRFDAASARVRSAEQSGDQTQIRAAYDQLRHLQSVRPAGQASKGKPKPAQAAPKQAAPRRQGVLSYISDVLRGANER